MEKILLVNLLLIFLISSISGEVAERLYIYVPEDSTTIQQAIISADEGDIMIVSPGTYCENISFLGKEITVASMYYTTQDSSYIENTIIDGGGTFCNEGSNTTLVNVMVENNSANMFEGGGYTCLSCY